MTLIGKSTKDMCIKLNYLPKSFINVPNINHFKCGICMLIINVEPYSTRILGIFFPKLQAVT